jgi:hypothetical protein
MSACKYACALELCFDDDDDDDDNDDDDDVNDNDGGTLICVDEEEQEYDELEYILGYCGTFPSN